jgi:TRAP transporter TAXI family solute receptor
VLATGVLAAGMTGEVHSQTVGLASLPQGSLFHRSLTAIAKLMNEKLGVKARVQPYSGSTTLIPILNNNEVSFSLNTTIDAEASFNGEKAFKGKPQKNLRLVAPVFPLGLSVLVAADSKIRKVSDVKGLRLPSGYTGQNVVRTLQAAVLANGGLTPADVGKYPVPSNHKGTEALGQGKVDAAVIAPGVAAITKANIKLRKRGGVRFISIDNSPEAVARMKKIAPVFAMLEKPAKGRIGIEKPTWFMAFSIVLLANNKTPDKLVYDTLKLIYDNKDELAKSSRILGRINADRIYEELRIPYHPGAIKFLKERGKWPKS